MKMISMNRIWGTKSPLTSAILSRRINVGRRNIELLANKHSLVSLQYQQLASKNTFGFSFSSNNNNNNNNHQQGGNNNTIPNEQLESETRNTSHSVKQMPGESKNAAKAREKAERLERERAEKAAKKAALEASSALLKGESSTGSSNNNNNQQKTIEELDPTAYFENRSHAIKELMKSGNPYPYPHKFAVSHSVSQFIEAFDSRLTENGQVLEDEIVSLGARITALRAQGKFLVFYTVTQEGKQLQILANKSNYTDLELSFEEVNSLFKRGDIIGVIGKPCRSKKGELSISPLKMQLLSPCLHMLPSFQTGLKDQETRYRKRYLDLIMNENVRNIFVTRTRIVSYIRRFLDARGYLEVETPMMNMIPGGAAARPFKTHHNDLNMDIFMRIAPELYLKNLVIGGLERVYEMGKQFRNESIDRTHNPEFTTIEMYQAYADYEDMMRLIEELLSGLVKELTGSYKVKFHPLGKDSHPEIVSEMDFTPPFRRVSMMEALAEKINAPMPTNYETEEARQFFDEMAVKHGVACSAPRSISRLIDKLVGHFLEVDCVNPTFIMEHPQIMSPLAKYHRSKPGVTERFELFANKFELANAFTELNDPFKQREIFMQQAKDKDNGDDEAMGYDKDFCESLEYALPPTGGMGIGIDRLIMLLTDNIYIQEVLLFPAMKPIIEQKKESSQSGDKNEE